MVRFAVIGTNTITEQFIEATQQSGKMRLAAVYSRSLQQAQRFASRYHVTACYDSFTAIAESEEIDAVYIASPNSLHSEQSQFFLNHGKHVLCEKPLASNLKEAEAVIACAKKNQRILLEAYKTAWLPNFRLLQTKLATIGTVHKAMFQYCQYSSRYPRYLNGENPNTFNPVFSNGSAMDIGYYAIAAAVSLWGEPESLSASAHLLPSGVDGHGSIIFKYKAFDLTILHSKVTNSHLPSEIQGEEGVLTINAISRFEQITHHPRGKQPIDISLPQPENTMCYEADAFVELIQRGDVDHLGLQHSLSTARLLTEVRRQTGVVFPADLR